MKLTTSLVQQVPSLKNVEVNESNVLSVAIAIAHSDYSLKMQTLATIMTTLCDVGPRVWFDHSLKVMAMQFDEIFRDEQTLHGFATKYAAFIADVETKAAEFGASIGEPPNVTL